MLTESMEMYLVAIFRLTQHQQLTTTKEIATHLNISQPSVTEQLKRLAKRGYVNYRWRAGAQLTNAGRHIALKVLRKHRLMETFLVQCAGYHLDEVHAEACRLQHALSDRLADALDEMLNQPALDPHGHPIPTREGTVATVTVTPLVDIKPGQTVVIKQVSDAIPEQLRYLREVGLVPGVQVQMIGVAPFNGPISLDVAGTTLAIGQAIAADIGVIIAADNSVINETKE